MKRPRTLCAFWSAFSTHPITRRRVAITAVLLAMLMIGWGISTGAVNVLSIFKTYPDDAGTLRSATADSTLDATNKFFDPALGRNGQSCATCHQPFDGFTISTETINDAFVATNGLDPLFRCNDPADNPAASEPTADNYNLFLELGVVRLVARGEASSSVSRFPKNVSNNLLKHISRSLRRLGERHEG